MRPVTALTAPAALAAVLALTAPAAATTTGPHITSITPGSGPTTGGYTVTVTGTGLSDVTSVQFGAGNYSPNWIDTSTLLTAQVPAGPPRRVHVIVTAPEGTARIAFTYTQAAGQAR